MPEPEPSDPASGADHPDPIDSADLDVLRTEILGLRDPIRGAEAREQVLDDPVAELEQQVDSLAAETDRLSALASNPMVRATAAVTRPLRRLLGGRRGGS